MNADVTYNEICKKKQGQYTRKEVEERAIEIHRLIHENQEKIWYDEIPTDRLEMLNPAVAAQLIGFNCDEVESLGENLISGNKFEVAGQIDIRHKKIQVSLQYAPEIRNYTLAHELGHAALHRETGLHRDRPIDGSKVSRNQTEREADWFATFFLMPTKSVRNRFKETFLTDNFILDENTAFALGYDYSSFINRFKNLRQVSRILASTGYYNNKHIVPLAAQFKVSNEAMAIRLEELFLVNKEALSTVLRGS